MTPRLTTQFRHSLADLRWQLAQFRRDYARFADLGPTAALRLAAAELAGRARPGAAPKPWPVRVHGSRHPVFVRPGSSDAGVLLQVFGERQYGCVGAETPPLRTVVDGGGNVGLTSAYLLGRYPQARVALVEPDAANLAVARRALAPYGGRVQFIQAALWPDAAPLRLVRNPLPGGEWAVRAEPCAPGLAPDLVGVPLAGVFDRAGFATVDLLKLDIEGAEVELFAPAARPELWLPRVRRLVIELHGPECASVVGAAVRPFPHTTEARGELTVFRFAGGAA